MRGLGLGPRKLGWHGSGCGEGSMDLASSGYRSSHRGGSHGGCGEDPMDLATSGYRSSHAVVPMVAVVKAPWTSPWVATEVATTVVPMVEARGDDAAPLIVAFCFTDLGNSLS
ncbi:hypothetical protein ACFX2J_008817 [Malus domestica]